MKFSWNQPICERCWIERDGNWTDEGIHLPVRLTAEDTELHQCSYCGYPTFVGIFVRDNPDNVKFPKEKEDD